MKLVKGSFFYEHECCEVMTGRLWGNLPNQDCVFVQLAYYKDHLEKVNQILAQFGFPEVVEVDDTEVRKETDSSIRIFGQHWVKIITPRSTPLFHATLRALRDGAEWEYILLEVAAKIESEHGCHWLSVKGIDQFLLNYVHPKLYAEQVKDILDRLSNMTASLVLLQLGLGPKVKKAVKRDFRFSYLEPYGKVHLGTEYTDFHTLIYEYAREGCEKFTTGVMATSGVPGIGHSVYYIHDDPTVLDNRNWLVK